MTRWETREKGGEEILFPPNPAEYLTDWLNEIGPSKSAGMGAAPISFGDMRDWQMITGVELEPWEGRILRRLSVEYVNEQYHARKPDRLAPYTGGPEDMRSNRDRVRDKIKAMFGGRKNTG